MEFLCDGKELEYDFVAVPLSFEAGIYTDVFKDKNNKTVKTTLEHYRYEKLKEDTFRHYSKFLDWPLGKFLVFLKQSGDDDYKRFLNKYGDSEYSKFFITDESILNKKGIYIYTLFEQITYVGRSTDSMKKRINQGYGKIHPKNCYLDGQATNCHLNTLITEHKKDISLWLHIMEDKEDIERIEARLIWACNPPWNIALKRC